MNMPEPQDKSNKEMQEYARKWMRSLNQSRYSTNISNFFTAIFIFFWSSTLTNHLGYTPFNGFGFIVILCIAIVIILALLFTNSILSTIGFSKSIRSALWFSALVGPYISIIAINNWRNPTLSHIAGVFSSVIAFLISFVLDKVLIRESQSSADKKTTVNP
jgi:sensor histidine kinase YesM